MSGTEISRELLSSLLEATRVPQGTHSEFGIAMFHGAKFYDAGPRGADFIGGQRLAQLSDSTREAGGGFEGVVFRDRAFFIGARFIGPVSFAQAQFCDFALFEGVTFEGGAWFGTVGFQGQVSFSYAQFEGECWFGEAVIVGDASFDCAKFSMDAYFPHVRFNGNAQFSGAAFEKRAVFGGVKVGARMIFGEVSFNSNVTLGPLVCSGDIVLQAAIMRGAALVEAEAREIICRRASFEAPITIRARRAVVDLTNATLLQPCAVTTDFAPDRPQVIALENVTVSVSSIRGVDASMLLLSDTDLSQCSFAGTHNLDQLRLEGRWDLSSAPTGLYWHKGIPRWWVKRQVIREERDWRALPSRPPAARSGWGQPTRGTDPAPGLATITSTYRQLRKAREDAKDEPGAADLYYGEMEMRRHSHNWRHAERWLLQAYWMLSGYGLRASRSLGWLAAAMTATVFLMMGYGLPDSPPKQQLTGTVPANGGKATFEVEKPDPHNPTRDRFTLIRFEKALSITLNSVVFRSTGQDLTTTGNYIEMVSRFSEPILLGLGALAIRGRVKRGS
ncbi:pentapeptide repeat-containing protein [Streptomyces sp. DR7-3]|uniref:pentapeptide repeat-containing protein n=1 Tax=Streptomyces malaysiensis TaxID=92644 RepID=UPI0020442E48|nr:pentapeptide repeat-containing protein [Streptomyces sp. DR7-3]MCM3811421.1 pentapeptide repeat-containing protein [Streptomyces sp. DR7-3]